jgi:HAD superfamily hydrolase (TIGR01509 family)
MNHAGPAARAVIFDLDGTLVDSEPLYLASEQRLLGELGVEGFDEEAKLPYVGMSTRAILADLAAKHGFTETVDVLAERNVRYYLELVRERLVVFPAMVELLRLLAADGVPLALASGSTSEVIAAVLDVTGLGPYFEFWVSADQVAHGKPAPDLFLHSAERLGAAPEGCVVVEDSWPGREAARRAGMRCLFVAGSAHQLRHEPSDTELVFPERGTGFVPAEALRWIKDPSAGPVV